MKGVGILIFALVLALAATGMYTGEQMYLYDVANNDTQNITETVESVFNWTYTSSTTASTYTGTNRYQNVLERGVDFFGYTTFEMTKGFIEHGYNHPGEINYNRFLRGTEFFVWGAIIAMFFYPLMIGCMVLIHIVKILIVTFKKLKLKYMGDK